MSQFVPLTSKERAEAYRDVAGMNRPIQIQIAGEKLRQGKAYQRELGEVAFRLPHVQRFTGEQEAIITFSLPPEVFFLKTTVVGQGAKFFFRESKNIYRLQRRDSFRLSIPDRVEAKVEFNGKTHRIFDVSQGGLSIELPVAQSQTFPTGTRVEGHLTILTTEFANILCEAKHARIRPSDKTKVLVGFQFVKLTSPQEEHIFRLITDIARRHFRPF